MADHSELSDQAKRVLEALCEAAEGPSDGEWRNVYLDNARAKLDGMSVASFRRYLGVLSDAGFYRVIDGYAWGDVRDEAFQTIPA